MTVILERAVTAERAHCHVEDQVAFLRRTVETVMGVVPALATLKHHRLQPSFGATTDGDLVVRISLEPLVQLRLFESATRVRSIRQGERSKLARQELDAISESIREAQRDVDKMTAAARADFACFLQVATDRQRQLHRAVVRDGGLELCFQLLSQERSLCLPFLGGPLEDAEIAMVNLALKSISASDARAFAILTTPGRNGAPFSQPIAKFILHPVAAKFTAEDRQLLADAFSAERRIDVLVHLRRAAESGQVVGGRLISVAASSQGLT